MADDNRQRTRNDDDYGYARIPDARYADGAGAPGGHQVELDQQGGDPRERGSRQDDISALREGGQTNYRGMVDNPAEPFDTVRSLPKPSYETRFMDVDVQPVPIATQEDRSLLVYDWLQKQYNFAASAGGAADIELDVVEANAAWIIDRVAIFGTATGFVQLFDGLSNDGSNCIAVQAGVATILGGVQTLQSVLMTRRSPLRCKCTGVDANAAISIGVWYRKARWVWTPPKQIEDAANMSSVEQYYSPGPATGG
jgi:hypothetical protein